MAPNMATKKRRRPRAVTEFRTLLEQAGLSQLAAARALRLGARTIRSYALGERRIPYPVVLALLYLTENPPTDD